MHALVLDRLRARQSPEDPRLATPQSDQERQILELIAEGLTNRQIGERLFLAEKTVKNYVSNLFTSSVSPAAPRPPSMPANDAGPATDRRLTDIAPDQYVDRHPASAK